MPEKCPSFGVHRHLKTRAEVTKVFEAISTGLDATALGIEIVGTGLVVAACHIGAVSGFTLDPAFKPLSGAAGCIGGAMVTDIAVSGMMLPFAVGSSLGADAADFAAEVSTGDTYLAISYSVESSGDNFRLESVLIGIGPETNFNLMQAANQSIPEIMYQLFAQAYDIWGLNPFDSTIETQLYP